MAEATPDPACITVKGCGTNVRTQLEGFILPAPDDAIPACADLTVDDYVGSGLILTKIGEYWHVLGLCGNTGLGLYYYGCLSGGLTTQLDEGGDGCEFVSTGEMVTAQICKTECEPAFAIGDADSVVVMAKIGEQWFIVNVVDRGFITNIPDFKTPSCADACCGVGLNQIQATIGSGCGALSGETFYLSGGGSWSGSVTAGGDTFSMTITCTIEEAGAEDWVILGGCGSEAAADSFNVICDTGMSGDATFSGMACGLCSSVVVTFLAVAPPDDRPCDSVSPTGVEVVMEACGLPALTIGDRVIMAKVPKVGSPCAFTGTGTPNEPQWQMIQACSDNINCGAPCPPPPPPEDALCCEWNELEIPTTLTGILSLASDDAGCECSETVVFELGTGTFPPVWEQVGSTCSTSTSTGTGGNGNALTGLTQLSITCGGGTGTGTGTGTGGLSAGFLLEGPSGPLATGHASSSSCDPLMIEWGPIETGIEHCSGGTFPPTSVAVSLEVTG